MYSHRKRPIFCEKNLVAINIRDRNGNTPLHLATSDDLGHDYIRCQVVFELLKAGADIKLLENQLENVNYCSCVEKSSCVVSAYLKKLSLLGYELPNNVKDYFFAAASHEKILNLGAELNDLDKIVINVSSKRTMKDIIFLKRYEIGMYAKNEVVKKFFNTESNFLMFPNAIDVLKLIYYRVRYRNWLEEKALLKLYSYCRYNFPQDCILSIFTFLNNKEILKISQIQN